MNVLPQSVYHIVFIVTTHMKKLILHGIKLLIHCMAMLYVEEY
jgi:hypothetical protein